MKILSRPERRRTTYYGVKTVNASIATTAGLIMLWRSTKRLYSLGHRPISLDIFSSLSLHTKFNYIGIFSILNLRNTAITGYELMVIELMYVIEEQHVQINRVSGSADLSSSSESFDVCSQ